MSQTIKFPTVTSGKGFEIRAEAESFEILIYGVIGDPWDGLMAKDVAEALQGQKDVKLITMRINSPGGSVFEATAIFNLLVQHSARVEVFIDSMALSAASMLAMAGDEIHIAANGMMMIHNPIGLVWGGADEMRKNADLLDKVKELLVGTYEARTGQPEKQIRDWMDEERFFDAEEAVLYGFATATMEAKRIAACADLADFDKCVAQYRRAPDGLKAIRANSVQVTTAPERNTTPSNTKGVVEMATEDAKTASAEVAKKTEAPTTGMPGKLEGTVVVGQTLAPVEANYGDIKDACPGCDAEFICAQFEAKATPEQATKAWMGEQQKRIEARDAELDAERAKAGKPGVKAVTTKGGDAGGDAIEDPIGEWEKLLTAKLATGGNRAKAVQALVRENPELHKAYIVAYNEKHGRPRAARLYAETH